MLWDQLLVCNFNIAYPHVSMYNESNLNVCHGNWAETNNPVFKRIFGVFLDLCMGRVKLCSDLDNGVWALYFHQCVMLLERSH